jgi:branched-subunit amino acid aminotransferase/4-amino-4-deoxychorismate lyase
LATAQPSTPPAEVDGEPVTGARAAALGTLNYGHFTTMRVDDLRVRGLHLHLDRLVRDCAAVFGAGLDVDRVRNLLRRVAARCERPTLLRVTVFDPVGSVARPGLSDPAPDARPSILISTRAAGPGGASPGLRVRTVPYVRDLPAVKHLGMFGPLHQRRLAQSAGFDDALFLAGPQSSAPVGEGPTWNVAVLIDDELSWPDDECLPGVTRELLRRAIEPAGGDGSDRAVTRADLPRVQAAFVTSAGVGVQPIAAIDDVPLPGDPQLLDRLRAAYAAVPGEVI